MAKQQQKRRRKRYQPGSAYAGDVRPTGILGFMGSTAMIRLIFIGMAAALVIGGGFAIFGTGAFTRGGGSADGNPNIVLPDDDLGSGPIDDPSEVRQYDAPPSMVIDLEKSYVATISTELGEIRLELFNDTAPETVNNFVFLAREGFYDGLTFHFVNQSTANVGDPACTVGSRCGGRGGPGYELSERISGDYTIGTLGMINGSQFFIALSDADTEQYADFTPFGQIVFGLEQAEQLVQGTTIEEIKILEQ